MEQPQNKNEHLKNDTYNIRYHNIIDKLPTQISYNMEDVMDMDDMINTENIQNFEMFVASKSYEFLGLFFKAKCDRTLANYEYFKKLDSYFSVLKDILNAFNAVYIIDKIKIIEEYIQKMKKELRFKEKPPRLLESKPVNIPQQQHHIINIPFLPQYKMWEHPRPHMAHVPRYINNHRDINMYVPPPPVYPHVPSCIKPQAVPTLIEPRLPRFIEQPVPSKYIPPPLRGDCVAINM